MKTKYNFLWNIWCCISIIGIWPRYIEPNLLFLNHKKIPIKQLPSDLVGFKILQFSDLHLNEGISDHFIKKLCRKINLANPDLIVFTGDFLCYSKLIQKERLKELLKAIPQAKYGNYAILGNHDYEKYVFINQDGDYDCEDKVVKSSLLRGFKRLFSTITITKKFADSLCELKPNNELIELLKESSFQLLHNETEGVLVNSSKLNICGLGEYMAGQLNPIQAFKNYDRDFPGIILAHNPDSLRYLKGYPGEVAFCGHTHGGQINIPFLAHKFLLLENRKFKRGLIKDGNRLVYINRGIAGVLNFRCFSPPEILLAELTLED